MNRLLSQIVPFLLICAAVFLFMFGIVILAYLLLFGAMVGLVLLFVSWFRNWFNRHFRKNQPFNKEKPQPKTGRIIDSDDWKEL